MREIKFRAWLPEIKKMTYPMTIAELVGGHATSGTTPVWLQFTGLKDKKGKEIYEGDIVERISRRCQVIWFDSSLFAGWDLKPLNADGNPPSEQSLWLDWTIIGNIHENPDLLAEGKSCAG